MTTDHKLEDLAISNTGFVFDPYTGSTFSVNDTGRMILDGLRNGSSRDEIATLIRERFEIGDEVDIDRDIDDFLHLLRRNALVPEGFRL